MTESHEDFVQPGSPTDRTPASNALPFHELLEQVEGLSPEDQDALIDVIRRRRVDLRRAEIAENIRKSRNELGSGAVTRGTVDELMEEFGR